MCEGSASNSGRSLPPAKSRYPLYRRLGGPQCRSGQVRKISPPPGFNPRTVQSVASSYTDWATRPTDVRNLACKYGIHTGRPSFKLPYSQSAQNSDKYILCSVLDWNFKMQIHYVLCLGLKMEERQNCIKASFKCLIHQTIIWLIQERCVGREPDSFVREIRNSYKILCGKTRLGELSVSGRVI